MVNVNRANANTTNTQMPDRRAGEDGAYVVQRGDTLNEIATRHGVNLQQILDENPQFRANPDLIHPGQRVKIPTASSASTSTAASSTGDNAAATMPDEPDASSSSRARPRDRSAGPRSEIDPASLSAPGERSSNLGAVDKLIDKTARVEGGGRYDAFNPNDNGHGISFGLIQFNQKAGSLPTLLKEMHAKDPAKFNKVFGSDAQRLLDEKTVRSANLATPDMRAKFRAAGAVPELQQVQRDLAKRDYFDPAQRVGEQNGIKSERGMAMLFDASVQLGVGGMTQRLKAAAAQGGSEREILERFAASADNVTGGHNRRRNLLDDPTLSDGPIGTAPTAPLDGDEAGLSPNGTRGGKHIVKPGESLASIAAQYGTTWQELYEANKSSIANPRVIHAGQSLKLPNQPFVDDGVAADAQGTSSTTGAGEASASGSELGKRVMADAKQIGDQINATGGYRFDGVNDCWGFVRRVLDPNLKAQGLPALPTADADTPAGRKNWNRITDWSQVPVGTPLSTHQGHAWGAQWHGGIFAGMKDGVPMIYDNSGSKSAQLRPLPNPEYFKYFHVPSANVLR